MLVSIFILASSCNVLKKSGGFRIDCAIENGTCNINSIRDRGEFKSALIAEGAVDDFSDTRWRLVATRDLEAVFYGG